MATSCNITTTTSDITMKTAPRQHHLCVVRTSSNIIAGSQKTVTAVRVPNSLVQTPVLVSKYLILLPPRSRVF